MKLEIGKPDYPYQHAIREAVIRGRIKGRDLPLLMVTMSEMERLHDAHEVKDKQYLRGTPLYISHDAKAKRVWVFPSPSGEYELDITRDPEIAGTITKATIAKKREEVKS